MAPISLKKGLIDKLAGDLIMHILQIEKTSENFKISMEYVMSNFRFNRFLDVNPIDVSRSITGLCSKFRVNSMDKKAKYLEKKVDEFVNSSLLETKVEEKETQTDAHYGLLLFLMKLSNNPLSSDFKPKEKVQQQNDEDTFNWTKYLLLGEEPLEIGANVGDSDLEKNLYDSDNEIWQLSEDEEESDNKETEKNFADVLEQKLPKGSAIDSEEKDWISENIITPYWLESEKPSFTFRITSTTYQNSNHMTCNNWELHKRQFTNTTTDSQLLSERILVRETLWMLLGLENLHVYKFIEGKYQANQDIVLTHLTRDTLNKFLLSFTEVGTRVLLLKRFTETCAKKFSEIPKTIQAFAFTISKFLATRRELLAKLEKQFTIRENTTTLLILRDLLADDISKVNFIFKIYNKAVVEGHDRYFTVTERVVHFLDVFYDFVCTLDNMGDAGTEKMTIVLPMFLEVCRPYLEDVGWWMATGELPRDEEFMIYRTQKQVRGETRYWHEIFLIKENRSSRKLVPSFLQNLQKQILVSGKSLGLLEEFVEFTSTVVASESLYKDFKSILKKTLKESNERYMKGFDKTDGKEVDGPTEYIKDTTIDPLLRENFKIMFNNVFQRLKSNKEQTPSNKITYTEDEDKFDSLLRDCSCRPPMKMIIEQSLSPVVLNRYEKACVVLLELFNKEMKFLKHLAVMKNFFLMQATGEMYEFYTEIFEKAKHGRYWRDMSYLNIVLQDALQANYPELMGSLKVGYHSSKSTLSNAQLFDGLSLHYKVPWPVSIVLDQNAEDVYNEVFRFIFKVKRAIWVLEQLRFQELVYQSRTQSSDDADDDVIEDRSPKYKQHMLKDFSLSSAHQKLKMRMVVLRMKMLHVIRSFHFYLMTRIDDSIHQEFPVKSARDLNEILELHQKFLLTLKQRCFLYEKVARTKEALVRVLNLAFEFEEMWRGSIAVVNTNQLGSLEKEFFRCTSFLQSFFTTLAKRGSFPHFEFLANSMKFDAPR